MARPDLAIEPFASIADCKLMIDYFHRASDEALRVMRVDRRLVPAPGVWLRQLLSDLDRALTERTAYYLSWWLDGRPVGHSNVNRLVYGSDAFVHLHLWDTDLRNRGLGGQFFARSVAHYLEVLRLQRIVCEPCADNPHANRVLARAGFLWVRRERTIPGPLCVPQDVNRWELDLRK